MKSLVLKTFAIASLSLIFAECRYKDNRGIHLQPARRRLDRTWHLLEAYQIDSGINLITRKPALASATLQIGGHEENKLIALKSTYLPTFIKAALTGNKNKIQPVNFNSTEPVEGYSLKIERLTDNDLWLRGNPIFRLVDSDPDSTTVYLRYEAVPER